MTSVLTFAKTSALAAVTVALMSSGGMAQEATEQAAEAAPAEAAPVAEDALQVGQAYVKEEIGDWEFRCIKVPEGQIEPCSMYQLLKDETGNDVAEVTIFTLKQDTVEAAMTITAPLETLLTPQLSFFVDGQNGRRYPFASCSAVGCTARAGLTLDEVSALKKGNVAQVGIVPLATPNQAVTLNMSLTGFTKAYETVSASNAASREAAEAAQAQQVEQAPAAE